MFKLAVVIVVSLAVIKETWALPEEAKSDETEKVDVETAEQHDFPFGGMGMGGMGGMGNGYGMNGMGTNAAVNFDFNCKCQAKSNLPKNLQIPTDANQAAQQQINQLNDQIRRLNEQLRKTQQGQSTFEQFAQILSMADGLDCNCSGSSAPFNNFPFESSNNQMGMGMSSMGGMGGQMPFMPRGNMVSSAMGQRIFPGMLAGAMFP